MKRGTHNQRGFIALISVVIMSAILLVLLFTLDITSFFDRFDALDIENKHVSAALAEACIQSALLRNAQGNYATGSVGLDIADPEKRCTICTNTASGVIKTRAVYRGAYTSLNVAITPVLGAVHITSWSEVGAGDSSCVVP